jgi:hypothetical protein
MEIESDFIMTCLENGIIILEADNDVGKKSLWQRIKEFFAEIFGIFKEKVMGIYESNKRWMDDRK